MNTLWLALRSFLFYVGYVGSLIICAVVCIIIGPFLPLRWRFPVFMFWSRIVSFLLLLCCGIRIRVQGREHIPEGSYVLLSNHQSSFETFFFYEYFQPIAAILKRELLSIPFFGWATRLLRPIPIDRSNKRKAREQVLKEGQQRLQDEGISVLIFPEGTRVKPGEHRKFSAGGAELAIQAGVPVLPVAHNAGLCWPGRRFLKYPGTIDIHILPPLSSENRSPKELIHEVEALIRSELAQLKPTHRDY